MNVLRFAAIAVLACFIALAATPSVQAVPIDVTNPLDPITPSSGNHPGGEAAPNAIDNLHNTKYLNFDELNTGFTVQASDPGGVVRAISIESANDAPERDPTSFVLEGSNDGGMSFSMIATGDVPTFGNRHESKTISFENDTAYTQYRLTIPTVANAAAANSMQVGEVQLLTHADVTNPGDLIFGTSTNVPAGERPRNAIDNRFNGTKYLNFDETNTGFIVVPNSGLSVVTGLGLTSANDAPERDPTSFVLEGTNDGVTFTPIASGMLPAFDSRFQTREVSFANDQVFGAYRLIFPTVANEGAANSMQIGQVEVFGDVVQPHDFHSLDISSAFNADVILNNGNGGLDLVGEGVDSGNRAYLTQSAANERGGGAGNGLPDDGLFTNTPFGAPVQLAYNNSDDGNNAIRLTGSQGGFISLLPEDQGQYVSLYLLATNGDGDGMLDLTLQYSDGTMQSESIVVDDWFNDDGELEDGVFALINGLDRTGIDLAGFEDINDPAIFAIGLLADSTRTLIGIDVQKTGGGVTNIFGIAGARLAAGVPEPTTGLLGLLGVAALGFRRRRDAA